MRMVHFRAWPWWMRTALVVAVAAFYGLAFVPLYHAMGGTAIVLSVLLTAAAGLLLGWLAGLLVGLLSVLLNGLLFSLVQDTVLSPGGLLGSGMAVLMGALTGWLKTLLDRLAKQSRELEDARAALREENAQRRQAEAKLCQAQETAAAAHHAKSAFLSKISHDVCTPAGLIISYIELLQDEAADRGYTDLLPDLDRVRMASKQLLDMINDALDLTRIETGRLQLCPRVFDVTALVHDAVSRVQPVVKRNGNTLDVRCKDLGQMRADPDGVRRILLGVLDRAAQYTSQGTITVAAVRETAADGLDWMRFCITDTGRGMTSEHVQGLLRPFDPADAATGRDYSGIGLGLALSSSFCQMMGGELTVESVVGQGTVWTIRLPADGPPVASQ